MPRIGKHLLMEFNECPADKLDDLELIQESMLEAARLMEVTVLFHNFHQFSPQGISGAVIIAESHLTIHTWPEHGYAAADFFTCGDHINAHTGMFHLMDQLGSERSHLREVFRSYQKKVKV